MKSLIIFIFISGWIFSPTYAQDTLRLYLNSNFESVENEMAVIIRDAVIHNGRYFITDQYTDGRMIVTGEYSSVSPWVEDGAFRYYDESGNLYSQGSYKNGSLSGKWVFYKNGVPDTVDYEPALARYSYNSSQENRKFPQKPNTKASKELVKIIGEKLRFPPRLMNEYPFTYVLMRLSFDDENNLVPQVLYSIHPDFEIETLRVLLAAPDSVLYGNGKRSGNLCYDISANFNLEYQQDTTDKDSLYVFVFVEEQAVFMGGNIDTFRDWVQKNLRYPPEAVEKGQFGRVTTQFIVTTEGEVKGIKILRGVSPALDQEVIRVMKSSPKWIPAKQYGKDVNQQFVIPVIFMLQ